MKVFSIANLKGGSGKTTLAVNLALHLQQRGHRTLFVDLDGNNNGTDFFLRHVTAAGIEERSILQVLTRNLPLDECIHATPSGVGVVPATVSLNGLDAAVHGNPAPLLALRSYLSQSDYEYAVLDCPPHNSSPFRAGLWAADIVLSPVVGSRWTYQGVRFLETELHDAQLVTGHEKGLLLVPSMVTRGQAEVAKIAAMRTSHAVTESIIHLSPALRRMADTGQATKAQANASAMFGQLTEEILKWEKRQSKKQTTGSNNRKSSPAPVA